MTLNFDEEVDLSRTSNINNNNGERLLYSKLQKSSKTPTIIAFLIAKGIVKNEDSARLLLLIFSIVVFVFSAYLIIRSFSGPVFINKLSR
jgi:hypothetical protein